MIKNSPHSSKGGYDAMGSGLVNLSMAESPADTDGVNVAYVKEEIGRLSGRILTTRVSLTAVRAEDGGDRVELRRADPPGSALDDTAPITGFLTDGDSVTLEFEWYGAFDEVSAPFIVYRSVKRYVDPGRTEVLDPVLRRYRGLITMPVDEGLQVMRYGTDEGLSISIEVGRLLPVPKVVKAYFRPSATLQPGRTEFCQGDSAEIVVELERIGAERLLISAPFMEDIASVEVPAGALSVTARIPVEKDTQEPQYHGCAITVHVGEGYTQPFQTKNSQAQIPSDGYRAISVNGYVPTVRTTGTVYPVNQTALGLGNGATVHLEYLTGVSMDLSGNLMGDTPLQGRCVLHPDLSYSAYHATPETLFDPTRKPAQLKVDCANPMRYNLQEETPNVTIELMRTSNGKMAVLSHKVAIASAECRATATPTEGDVRSGETLSIPISYSQTGIAQHPTFVLFKDGQTYPLTFSEGMAIGTAPPKGGFYGIRISSDGRNAAWGGVSKFANGTNETIGVVSVDGFAPVDITSRISRVATSVGLSYYAIDVRGLPIGDMSKVRGVFGGHPFVGVNVISQSEYNSVVNSMTPSRGRDMMVVRDPSNPDRLGLSGWASVAFREVDPLAEYTIEETT